MARKINHERHVQKTGNILRTVLIWAGFLLGAIAGLIVLLSQGNERIALAMVIGSVLVYGFALRDFDIDDDD
ncbi:MAG: hypothetical protein KA604_00660 [Candidatus Saccharimonas sp.]|nr:hypothetical protein [Candidatus Saccharimonas sp.]